MSDATYDANHPVRLTPTGNAPIDVFPFFSLDTAEVILRHHDDSQDIELTPDEADQLADMLRAAAAFARDLNKPQE